MIYSKTARGFRVFPIQYKENGMTEITPFQVIDKVDAPEENEGSFSSDCKFSCALGSARAENLSGMKIPSRPGKRAFGNFLLGDVHAAACG